MSATQTWKPVKNGTTTVSDIGKWLMKNIDLINTAQFRIVAQFPQDDTFIAKTQPFSPLEPSIPRLISPKQTNQTISAQREATFSGTGQADDQLRMEIRTNVIVPWETKGQTQVDAQGKWEVKGITTQDNQEIRLVTQRPGGT
ncbi:hypothetical protein [Enterococcus sp. DIV0086]|uniref:hypothetical protein n=1 Tax=Enterococcus sp. DIV0086 TaxID=2774655 RepID=UPI003D2DD57F